MRNYTVTREQLVRAMALLLQVAAYPPKRSNRWGTTAYVPWNLIEECRALCDEIGLDVEAVRRAAAEPDQGKLLA